MNTYITAKNLLMLFLELKSLSPVINEWTEEELKSNPPRYYRMLQLKALIKAYNIESFEDFMNGSFIEKNVVEYYNVVFQKAKRELRTDKYDDMDTSHRSSTGVKSLFEMLLEYRCDIIPKEHEFKENSSWK